MKRTSNLAAPRKPYVPMDYYVRFRVKGEQVGSFLGPFKVAGRAERKMINVLNRLDVVPGSPELVERKRGEAAA